MRYSCNDCGIKFTWVRGEEIAQYTLVNEYGHEQHKRVQIGKERPARRPAYCPECGNLDIEEENI